MRRVRCRTVRVLEERPLARKSIDVGGRRTSISVGGDMIGAQAVDRQQETVVPGPVERSRNFTRSGGLRAFELNSVPVAGANPGLNGNHTTQQRGVLDQGDAQVGGSIDRGGYAV